MAISQDLLEILVCPLCKASLDLKSDGSGLKCIMQVGRLTNEWSKGCSPGESNTTTLTSPHWWTKSPFKSSNRFAFAVSSEVIVDTSIEKWRAPMFNRVT